MKCIKCNKEISKNDIYPSYKKGGRHVCKSCEREYKRAYRDKNRDIIRIRERVWLLENTLFNDYECSSDNDNV